MHNRKAISVLAMLGFFGCDCQNEGTLHQRKADLDVAPNPLVFDVAPHTTAAKNLTISNRGDYRLEVAGVSLERGGAEGFSLAGETAFVVEPGASRDLEVRFAAGDRESATGTLLIRSNAELEPETRVALEATRRQGPALIVCASSLDIPLAEDCGPPDAIDFGRVLIGEARDAVVTLRSEGTDPVFVSAIEFTGHPSLRIDLPELAFPATLVPGTSMQVSLHFLSTVPEPVTGVLGVHSNDAVSPEVAITVRGEGGEVGLCIDPTMLDFGILRAGSVKDLVLRLTNCGSFPLELTGAELFLGAPELTLVNGIGAPITLPPGAGLALELTVRYAPADEGADEGRLRILTSGGDAIVNVIGEASFACRLNVAPNPLAFTWIDRVGALPQSFVVENTGAEPCTLTGVAITEGARDGFAFQVTPFGNITTWNHLPRLLNPGESETIEVLFYPPDDFEHSVLHGRIEILALERPGEVTTVDLVGNMMFDSVCDGITVTPDSLTFGVIGAGQARVLRVTMRSELPGSRCRLDSVAITDDAMGAFSLQPNPPDVVHPEATLPVEFRPSVTGVHQGTLTVVTAETTPQTFTVALAGAAGTSDLCVEPRELPFGERTAPVTLTFNITACATHPVTVSALDWIAPDLEISTVNPPAVPFTLNPGDNRTITVQYAPADAGGDTGILAVRSNDMLRPEITVRAAGGREVVPAGSGRYLYYWQILGAAQGDIMRQPLQGNLTTESFWGMRSGRACSGCHQLTTDGRYSAITNIVDTTREIVIVDVEANAVTAEPGGYVDGLFLSWNPDVNAMPPYQYVYAQGGDLFVASLYTGFIGPLAGASDPGVFETMPAWGPDGQIAFVRGDVPAGSGFGLSGASSIYVVPETGGVAAPLAGASNNTFANYYPRYSPNGRWIAYTMSVQAQTTLSAWDARVQLVAADGSGTVLDLPALNEGASSYPTWSPNGDYLSFSSSRPGGAGSWDIYIAPIDPVTGAEGAAINVVEANTEWFEHSAQWSP